ARIETLDLVILIEQELQLPKFAIGSGLGHWRNKVIDNYSGAATLGLGPFAGIVNDVGIDIGKILEDYLRKAGGAQGRAFAWQPFEIAVLAQLDNGMSAEDFANPPIEGQVIVRRWQIGAVIHSGRILIITPRRLNADKDVSKEQTRNGETEGTVSDER